MSDPERFTWRGINFTWKHEAWGHFVGTCPVTKWHASVSPRGLTWEARLSLAGGGNPPETGDTPQEALERALNWWVRHIDSLRGPR